jgi:hypothetical protein
MHLTNALICSYTAANQGGSSTNNNKKEDKYKEVYIWQIFFSLALSSTGVR